MNDTLGLCPLTSLVSLSPKTRVSDHCPCIPFCRQFFPSQLHLFSLYFFDFFVVRNDLVYFIHPSDVGRHLETIRSLTREKDLRLKQKGN